MKKITITVLLAAIAGLCLPGERRAEAKPIERCVQVLEEPHPAACFSCFTLFCKPFCTLECKIVDDGGDDQ